MLTKVNIEEEKLEVSCLEERVKLVARKKYRADIDIQKIYDEAPVVNGKKKLDSLNFYHGCTNIIKWRLMPDLIYRGYYKDGVKQINYDEEDIEDCFTYILGKIHDKYDPKKGTLATFIRTWIRGYGQIIVQKQRRQYKYAKAFVSLDSTTNSNNIMEAHLHHDTTSISDLDDYLDEEYFGIDSDFTFTPEDVKQHRAFLESIYGKDDSDIDSIL